PIWVEIKNSSKSNKFE
ncbi:unnamed protein product, partial [Rotaria sp. Silwood1]